MAASSPSSHVLPGQRLQLTDWMHWVPVPKSQERESHLPILGQESPLTESPVAEGGWARVLGALLWVVGIFRLALPRLWAS